MCCMVLNRRDPFIWETRPQFQYRDKVLKFLITLEDFQMLTQLGTSSTLPHSTPEIPWSSVNTQSTQAPTCCVWMAFEEIIHAPFYHEHQWSQKCVALNGFDVFNFVNLKHTTLVRSLDQIQEQTEHFNWPLLQHTPGNVEGKLIRLFQKAFIEHSD